MGFVVSENSFPPVGGLEEPGKAGVIDASETSSELSFLDDSSFSVGDELLGSEGSLLPAVMTGPAGRVADAPEVTGGPLGNRPADGAAGDRSALERGPGLAQHVAETEGRDCLPHPARLTRGAHLLAKPDTCPGQRTDEDPPDEEQESAGQQQRHHTHPRLQPARPHVCTSRSLGRAPSTTLLCTRRTSVRARLPHL